MKVSVPAMTKRFLILSLLLMLLSTCWTFASAEANVYEGSTSDISKSQDGRDVSSAIQTKAKNVKVRSVSVKKSASVYVGKKITLKATVKPSNASNKAVTWKSSDTKVATVSSKGVVKGLKKGTVTITATTKDGKRKAKCKVAVKAVSVKSVSVKKSLTIYVGKTSTLKPTVKPTNASNKAVTWKSSDTRVATVNSKGVVTAKTAGTATITVTTKDKKKTAKCKVTVKAVAVTGVSMEKSAELYVGERLTLKPTVTPSNATDRSVTWNTSDASVASISSDGVVSALKAGTATITATSASDKNRTATCTVTVTEEDPSLTVSLNQSTAKLNLYTVPTVTLKATISPSGKKVTWSSGKSSVATVNSKGVVTAKGAGTATITAKVGSKTATCEVTVVRPTMRAYLYGQQKYKAKYGVTPLPAAPHNVGMMKTALSNAGYQSVKTYSDLSGVQLKTSFRSLANEGMTDDDITLIYYSGHGLEAQTSASNMNGALVGVDYNGSNLYYAIVYADELSTILSNIPGTVIVVLDSCLSGQQVSPTYKKSAGDQSAQAAYNASFIKAFTGGPQSKALSDDKYESGKFKVLTAAGPLESSYSYTLSNSSIPPFALFTLLFADGGGFDFTSGTKTAMHADSNDDNRVSLQEMWAYITEGVDYFVERDFMYQTTMMWPSNDSFPILRR